VSKGFIGFISCTRDKSIGDNLFACRLVLNGFFITCLHIMTAHLQVSIWLALALIVIFLTTLL